jgi:predicted  nucleic acid-binding Zn-ribbon protein
MPPALPAAQGSRTGILVGLVASVIIAVAMIILAIFNGQKLSKAETELLDLRDAHRPFLAESDLGDTRVQALNQLKTDNENPSFAGLPSAMQVSLAESDQLAKLVGGNATPDKAIKIAQSSLADASKKVGKVKDATGFNLPTDSLTGALASLSDQVIKLAGDLQAAKGQVDALQKQNQQILASQKGQLDDKDKLIAAANQNVDELQTKLKQAQEQTANAQAALQASATQSMKGLQDANAQQASQIQTKDKQILTQQKQLTGLKAKLKVARVSPTEAVIQHPDGTIIRVTDYNTCFINLGERQHVTKGLTFEVYDKAHGIPPLGDGMSDTNMPTGKASIEVFNVSPDTSECRIIKTQPGQQLVIGDLLMNLIYDPNTAYNFVVYGSFDLSNSGTASPGDAEIVKRLITQWGGKIQNDVDMDTDFVVMGTEPVVPAITDPNDAQQVLRHNEKQAQLEKYQAFIAKASQLSIPVMNQNRFLYFIGYFDQATR